MKARYSRRDFLKVSAGTVLTAALLSRARGAAFAGAGVNGVSPPVRKFITPLRGLGPTGIPVATPDKTLYPGVDYYKIGIGQFQDALHPDLKNPTTLYGYFDANNPVQKALGGVIVAESGTPVRISFTNELPPTHILPVDPSVLHPGHGARQDLAAVHLHGGFVPWPSDGGPFHWFTPPDPVTGAKMTGPSVVNWLPDNNGVPTDDLWYPNADSARLLWYHDHAMGLTRLNAYAGIASAYILRDAFEQNLIATGAIPGKVPGTELPLVITDKTFKQFPDQWGQPGDLWYPDTYDTEMFPLDPPPGAPPLPDVSCVPEFFGDTMCVNGTPYPYVKVEPRRYRFRVLNACQSAFLNLQLYYAKNADPTAANVKAAGPMFLQIGTEGGFLPAPVVVNTSKTLVLDPVTGNPKKYGLLLGPAERADIIVDFSRVPVGSRLVLYNDATGPFPGGDRPVAPVTPGVGPDTMNILQFQVVPLGVATGDAAADPPPPPLVLPPVHALPQHDAVVRNVALWEGIDQFGRVTPRLGSLAGELDFMAPATETPVAGSTEIWNIFNLTADAHPIHIHLVNFQVLGRAPIDPLTGDILGKFKKPDANEAGWKETVRANYGEAVRVIMQFNLPPNPVVPVNGTPTPVSVPVSPRLQAEGIDGYEYVWHCHILEHEEHDMMRPLVVLP